MKICGIICEYNPFHNGHAYHLEQAKRISGADFLICVMSGNFVQRGEASIFEKHLRAKHALECGADAVLELPIHFASSSAEFFAKGAIKLLHSIPSFSHLCFGAENDDATAFIDAAKLLNNEPTHISSKIQQLVSNGMSYAKARAQAFSEMIPSDFLTQSNNILGLEYTKALLQLNSTAQIIPIKRKGANYLENNLHKNFSSASAIRLAIKENKFEQLKNNLPDCVFKDFSEIRENNLNTLEKYAVLSSSKEELAKILDCTEGLENAFKSVAEKNAENFSEALTSARYTSSRIKRIALQNLLQIRKEDIQNALNSELYLSILAIKKDNHTLLSELGKSSFPLLVKNGDYKKLSNPAKVVFEKQIFADQIYAMTTNSPYIVPNAFIE